VLRERLSALLTEVWVLSSMSATSAAENPITSRSTSTARWRGGESVKGGEERERDRLTRLVAGVRAGAGVCNSFE